MLHRYRDADPEFAEMERDLWAHFETRMQLHAAYASLDNVLDCLLYRARYEAHKVKRRIVDAARERHDVYDRRDVIVPDVTMNPQTRSVVCGFRRYYAKGRSDRIAMGAIGYTRRTFARCPDAEDLMRLETECFVPIRAVQAALARARQAIAQADRYAPHFMDIAGLDAPASALGDDWPALPDPDGIELLPQRKLKADLEDDAESEADAAPVYVDEDDEF